MNHEKEALRKRLNEIEEQEEKQTIDLYYPEFKKFEGKCFKKRNTYGVDSRKYWVYYTKVTRVLPDYVYDTKGRGITSHYDGYYFEVMSDGDVQIRNIEQDYIHNLGKEITEDEFNEAWNKMVDKINNFK